MKNFRKIIYCLFILLLLFIFISPVFAGKMDACNYLGSTDGKKTIDIDEKIADTVHLLVLIIQIAVPILLIIFGSFDFVKAITGGKEDEIKKGQQVFIKRAIAAVIVFFVIAIVKFLVGFVIDKSESDNFLNCVDCFLDGSGSKNCLKRPTIKKS